MREHIVQRPEEAGEEGLRGVLECLFPCCRPQKYRTAYRFAPRPFSLPSFVAIVSNTDTVRLYRAVSRMDTKTIQGLFEAYHPAFVQWINDSSCANSTPRRPALT